jgi:LysW-gamma-L-lysine carboxypeptidase
MKAVIDDVGFLMEMVGIYSPTGKEAKLVDHLLQKTHGLGFKSRKDEAGNLVCETGSGKKTIMLVGHLDTVPGEIKVEVKGGRLFGRGSADAKGPLAAFIMAANRLKNPGKKIIVVGCVDEEGGSKGARNLLGKYDPSFVIVGEPSGWENLNLGYKGTFSIECTFFKQAEHTSTYNPNSKELAVGFYLDLKRFCDDFNGDKGVFERIDANLRHINSSNGEFSEETRMKIGFRVPIGFDVNKLKRYIESVGRGAKISYSDFDQPVKAEKNNALIRAFMSSIRTKGGTPKFKLKAGTSDMNILQAFGKPIVTYGPGDSSLDHTPKEHLDMEEYLKSIDILAEVLAKL